MKLRVLRAYLMNNIQVDSYQDGRWKVEGARADAEVLPTSSCMFKKRYRHSTHLLPPTYSINLVKNSHDDD